MACAEVQCIFSVFNVGIETSTGLPTAKVLCGDVGVAGIVSRAWGAVVSGMGGRVGGGRGGGWEGGVLTWWSGAGERD